LESSKGLLMHKRKPQINFQVDEALKLLYEEAKISGHVVTRFCAAGLLLMIEDPQARVHALERLRDWEEQYDGASPQDIRAFVQAAQAALQRGARATPRGPQARRGKKAARLSGSE
jgi:hypothetical protein